MHLVMVNKLKPPEWLWMAFARGYGDVVAGRLTSWDDVLGKRYANGRKRALARRQSELRYRVWHEVRRLNAGDGIGIGDELFQVVAEHFGITKRNVSELYRRMQRARGHNPISSHPIGESEDVFSAPERRCSGGNIPTTNCNSPREW